MTVSLVARPPSPNGTFSWPEYYLYADPETTTVLSIPMTVSLVARTPSPKGTFSWPVTSVIILGRWYSSRVLHI